MYYPTIYLILNNILKISDIFNKYKYYGFFKDTSKQMEEKFKKYEKQVTLLFA